MLVKLPVIPLNNISTNMEVYVLIKLVTALTLTLMTVGVNAKEASITEKLEARAEVVSNSAPSKQIHCLATAIYYEARGESLQGQRAVASVVINRVNSPRFPKSPCAVLYQKGQFSFIGKGYSAPRGQAWINAQTIAREYVNKKNGDIPHLFFTSLKRKGMRIGNHIFY